MSAQPPVDREPIYFYERPAGCGEWTCSGLCGQCDDPSYASWIQESVRRTVEEEQLREAEELRQEIATGELAIHHRMRDTQGTRWATGSYPAHGFSVVLAGEGPTLHIADTAKDRHEAAELLARRTSTTSRDTNSASSSRPESGNADVSRQRAARASSPQAAARQVAPSTSPRTEPVRPTAPRTPRTH